MDMNEHRASGAIEKIAAVEHTKPKGLRKNYRWFIVASITLLTLTNYLDRGNLSVAAPLIMDDLQISPTMMGVILSAFVWPYAIMSLPTGWAVDRFGAKLMMAVAAGSWTIIAILTGFARTVQQFVLLRVVLGISEAPLFPSAIKAANAWFPDHEKALASSIFLSASQFGLAIAPPLSTLLMVSYGWPAMFIIMGAFGFLGLVGWWVLYDEPERHKWLHEQELSYIRGGQLQDHPVSDNHSSAKDWIGLFRFPATWIIIIGAFGLQYVLWFYITWLPSYLQKAQNLSLDRVGFVAAIPYLAGGVAVIVGGKLSDALVRRGSHPFTSRRILLATSAVLTGLAMFATIYCTTPTMAVVMLTIGMVTYSLSSANYWTLAAEALTTNKMVASLAGIQNFGGFVGGGTAPILTGFLVEQYGGFHAALTVAGGLAFLSALMYGVLLRKQIPA